MGETLLDCVVDFEFVGVVVVVLERELDFVEDRVAVIVFVGKDVGVAFLERLTVFDALVVMVEVLVSERERVPEEDLLVLRVDVIVFEELEDDVGLRVPVFVLDVDTVAVFDLEFVVEREELLDRVVVLEEETDDDTDLVGNTLREGLVEIEIEGDADEERDELVLLEEDSEVLDVLDEETVREDVGHVVDVRETVVLPVDEREDETVFVSTLDLLGLRDIVEVLVGFVLLVGVLEDVEDFVEIPLDVVLLETTDVLVSVEDGRGDLVGTALLVDVRVDVAVSV